MRLLLEWDSESLILEPGSKFTLGRDKSSDIRIDDDRVSRTHLLINFANNIWSIEDFGSSNGTYLNGNKIKQLDIIEDLELDLGGIGNLTIRFRLLTPKESAQSQLRSFDSQSEFTSIQNLPTDAYQDSAGPQRIRLQQRIRIGRGNNCDWQIHSPNASRTHAEIVQSHDGGYELIDLKSTNGTFVNNVAISRKLLSVGDIVSIAGVKRKFTADGLELLAGVEGLSVTANKIGFEISGKKILNEVSFNLGPRTLTAIIGPSGSGKSTLLGVLTGRNKPSAGNILVAGQDLHQNFQELSLDIGLVPQSDILHTRLTVKQALRYGAQLRLPADTSRAEQLDRVAEVMDQLGLTERANLRIDRLSGGQRKRASIGLELLTSPRMLALDEPTSGLDPGLDAHVMETLRVLADEGQTVVLVTHSVDNLNYCDNVILLASGGHVAYAGPASTVFNKLGKSSWAEIFKLLATPDALLLSGSKQHVEVFSNSTNLRKVKRKQNFFKQIFTLGSRYLRVIASDKFYLTLLTLIPLIIGLIAYLAGSKYGFGPGYETKTGLIYNPFAQGSILVLILGSVFIGLSTSIQEVIKENSIRRREQDIGIRVSAYLISKLLVLGVISALQIFIFTAIVLFNRPLPENGILLNSSWVELILICIILGTCSMVLGLLISTVLTSEEQAMPALVGMTMVMIVLSGALPLQSDGVIGEISKLVPSYWATNALAATVDIVQLALISDRIEQSKWESSSATLTTSVGIIFLFSAIFSLVSYLNLRRRH